MLITKPASFLKIVGVIVIKALKSMSRMFKSNSASQNILIRA